MDILNAIWNLIINFLQAILNIIQAFFNAIISFLQGLLNIVSHIG